VGTEGLGDGSPPAGSRWGSEGEARYIQTNLQLSNAFLRRYVAESVFRLPLQSENSSDLREFHDPRVPVRHSEGPPFQKVRHSESRHSWSLHGIGLVLDTVTTRRLTLTLTLTVSLTVSCHCWKWLKMADPSEWRPLRMVGRHRPNMVGAG